MLPRNARAERPAGPEISFSKNSKRVLTRVTEARYGRTLAPADAVFDETLTFARRVLRELKVENLWLVKKVRAAAKLTAPAG